MYPFFSYCIMKYYQHRLSSPYVLLSFAVLGFLHVFCKYDFYYAEQFRLFRWSADYVVPFFQRIGGPINLWTTFLLQFYCQPGVGAAVNAVAFLLMAVGTSRLLRKIAPEWPLPFFGVAAGLMQCALATEIHYFPEQTWALIAAVWTFVGIAALMPRKRATTGKPLAVRCLAIVALIALLVYTCGPIVWGDFYYPSMLHANAHSYWPLGMVGAGIVVAFVLSRRQRPAKLQTEKSLVVFFKIQLLLGLCLGAWYFTQCHNAGSARLKQLDYYRNTQQWDAILTMPDLPTDKVVVYTNYQNLALAATGRLGDEFMNHGQTGPTGLQQVWQGLQFESDILSDIFMVQGHVAMAQKMAFIAMQYNHKLMHGRLMLRLIETNLILKEGKVAEKYIGLLEQTLFYADRAREYRKFLGHPELVSTDPYFGELQRCTEGCDIATNDLVYGLEQICRANPSHKAAFHYLGAYHLMNNDLEAFGRFLDAYHACPALQPLPACFKIAADHIQWSPSAAPSSVAPAPVSAPVDAYTAASPITATTE